MFHRRNQCRSASSDKSVRSVVRKAGGDYVGGTGIRIGTADMTPFLSKITGDFDGLFAIFFGKDGVTIGN